MGEPLAEFVPQRRSIDPRVPMSCSIDDLVADHAGGTIGVRQVVDVRDRGQGPV
jgi:hypothetical protein